MHPPQVLVWNPKRFVRRVDESFGEQQYCSQLDGRMATLMASDE
jgi:hypothetical protein